MLAWKRLDCPLAVSDSMSQYDQSMWDNGQSRPCVTQLHGFIPNQWLSHLVTTARHDMIIRIAWRRVSERAGSMSSFPALPDDPPNVSS